MASNATEIASAFRLRHKAFNVEMRNSQNDPATDSRLEFDAYDFKSKHLMVIDERSADTIGTYRINTFETVGSVKGFYSASEFRIAAFP